MMPFLSSDRFDEWTIREVKEIGEFLQESLMSVHDHAVLYLTDPEHECSFETVPDGAMMTDAQLRSFFALEDAMNSYLEIVRGGLTDNGQIDTEIS